MFRARPSEFFTWDFELFEGEKRVVRMGQSWFREAGYFLWGGREYQLTREGLWSGNFLLQFNGQVLADATKISPFLRCFDVRTEGRTLTLTAASVFTREFQLLVDGTVVGSVAPESFFSRRCTVSFPDDLGVPVQVFLFWLVVLMWRRAAQSG